MHAGFFIAAMQPRALGCPGVSRPLKLLTGRGSVHQRAVVSKQAAAASHEIRGCMFDVTSRAEVATLQRPHTAGTYISPCMSRSERITLWELVGLSCLCECSRRADCTRASVWYIKHNLKYTAFSFYFSLKHTQQTWTCVHTVQSETFQLWLVSQTPWRNELMVGGDFSRRMNSTSSVVAPFLSAVNAEFGVNDSKVSTFALCPVFHHQMQTCIYPSLALCFQTGNKYHRKASW